MSIQQDDPGIRGGRSGRRPGESRTRDAILSAAREQFAENGYDGATIRGIARAAGVDGALVHHFYGSKEGVFAAAIEGTFNSDEFHQAVMTGSTRKYGDRLVRLFFERWEDSAGQPQLLAMVRSAVTNEDAARRLREFVTGEMLDSVTRAISPDQPEMRATLVSSQLIGTAFLRYVLKFKNMADTDVDSLVRMIGPTVQRYLTGPI